MNGIHRKGNLINEQNPTLYFDPYDTINFIMDASGNDTTNIHKLRINTTNYRVDNDVNTVTNPPASNQGIAKGTITWTPNRKGRFFYNCHQHGKMYGIIIIGDGSEKYPDVEQITVDTVAPIISAQPQDLSGTDRTPSFTFTSNEAGTITSPMYTITPSDAQPNTNTITFSELAYTTYNITLTVTDNNNNISNTLTIPEFTISEETDGGGGGGGGGDGGGWWWWW